MVRQASLSPGVHLQTVLMDNLTTTLLGLPMHLQNGTTTPSIQHGQNCTHLSIWLPRGDVTLYLWGGHACALPCVFMHVCLKQDGQGHYSLIKPLWSAHVISSALGVPRATSTISHHLLTIYPGDNHPDPSAVAEAVWD